MTAEFDPRELAIPAAISYGVTVLGYVLYQIYNRIYLLKKSKLENITFNSPKIMGETWEDIDRRNKQKYNYIFE